MAKAVGASDEQAIHDGDALRSPRPAAGGAPLGGVPSTVGAEAPT